MTKPICYLHVGTSKTGTSAIQHALAKMQDQLLECGLNYPNLSKNFKAVLSLKITSGNAIAIHRCLRDGNDERLSKLLNPLSSRPENLVLSCEGLSKLSLVHLHKLAHTLSSIGFDIRCLVFFRPQTEWLVSKYLQSVKANNNKVYTLEDYVNLELRPDRFEAKWNWFALSNKLGKAFGNENISVKWYPSIIQTDSPGVVRTVLDWMGAELPNDCIPTREKIVNPTPGQEALIILEQLNLLGWGNKSFSDKFLNEAHKQGILGSKVTLSPLLTKKVHSTTYQSNAKLFKKYCPGLSADKELSLSMYNTKIEMPIKKNIDKLTEIATNTFREHISQT